MAGAPNRYNRTTEAYDFALFEGRGAENKYTVHKKSQELDVGTRKEENSLATTSKTQIYRIKKQRSRARTFRVVVSVFLLVVALGVTASIIFNQVRLTELTDQLDIKAQQLDESKSLYTQLKMRSDANLSLATVENFAKQNLGMRKIDQSQLVFVELSKGDKGEVVQNNNGGNFFTNLWDSIKNLLS